MAGRASLGELARRGRDKLTFVVSPPIESLGLWVEQLIAESTGKHGRGIVPVVDEPLAAPEAYGNDRVIVYLRNSDEPLEDLDEEIERLADAGQPTLTLSTHGPADLGRIFFLSEFATAVAGWALEINPFDQPNVQEAKDATKRVLEAGSMPRIEPAGDDQLRALLAGAEPPHYVAIMGFLPPSARSRRGGRRAEGGDPQLDRRRDHVRLRTAVPSLDRASCTRAGRPRGASCSSSTSLRATLEIPGAGYSFGTLIAAQAAGDLQTLRAHGLPAERVKLEGEPASAVRALTERIAALLGA